MGGMLLVRALVALALAALASGALAGGIEQFPDMLARERKMVRQAVSSCANEPSAADQIVVCGGNDNPRSRYRISASVFEEAGTAFSVHRSTADMLKSAERNCASATRTGCFEGVQLMPMVKAIGHLAEKLRNK